jgi:hypothetical protein
MLIIYDGTPETTPHNGATIYAVVHHRTQDFRHAVRGVVRMENGRPLLDVQGGYSIALAAGDRWREE